MVEVAVAGAHTREIWLRLPLEIEVAIEDRCRGWGHLYNFADTYHQLSEARDI